MPDPTLDPLSELTRPANPLDSLITKHAERTGLDPELVRRVVSQESRGKRGAVSPKGASGLMQLMPGTAAQLGVKNRFDPDENIRGGTDYLKQQLDRFGDPKLALAAYNAGPGAVIKHKGIPPYAETQNYVKKIAGDYQGTGYAQDPLSELTKPQKVQPQVDPLTELTRPALKTPQVTSSVREVDTGTEIPIEPIKFQQADNSELNRLARGVQNLSERVTTQGMNLPKNHPDLLGQRITTTFDHPPTQEEVDDAMMESLGKGYGSVAKKFREETGVPLTANNVAVDKQADGSYLVHARPTLGFIDAVNAYAQGGRPAYEATLSSQTAGRGAVARDIKANLDKGVLQDVGQAGVREMARTAQFAQNAADLVTGKDPQYDPNATAIARAEEAIPAPKTWTGSATEAGIGALGAINRAEALGGAPMFPTSAAIESAHKGPEAAYKSAIMTAPILAAGPIARAVGADEMGGLGRQLTTRGVAGAGMAIPAIASGASPRDIGTSFLEGAAFPTGERERPEELRVTPRGEVNANQTEAQPNITAQPESAQQPANMARTSIARTDEGSGRADVQQPVPESATGTSFADRGIGNTDLSGSEPPRHVDLQKRRVRGEGKGQFRSESKAEREERLAQVNPTEQPNTPTALEPQVVRPWEMTRDQVEEEYRRKKAEDDNLEATILGPELAKRYAQLQRAANSSYDTQRADRAYDEIQKIEASLSERDRNRLYGIGEEGPQVDELRDYRQSLGNLDDTDPQSLAESMRWAISRIGNETDPAKMSHEQQVAYGTLREAARIAHERGWDTQAISREAVKAAGARFSDPEDAAFMLDRFIKKAPTVREPKQISAPRETNTPVTQTTPEGFFANEKGEPLTVYHGTSRQFDQFEEGAAPNTPGPKGRGFHFSDNHDSFQHIGILSLEFHVDKLSRPLL